MTLIKARSILLFLLAALICLLYCSAALAAVSPDAYEDDDTYEKAGYIVLNGNSQQHNFHDEGDVDWIRFAAIEDKNHAIFVGSVGAGMDVYIELYDTDGVTLIERKNKFFEGDNETLEIVLEQAGIYYVKIGLVNEEAYGEDSDYQLRVAILEASTGYGTVHGRVKDYSSGDGIDGAEVRSSNNNKKVYTFGGGYYIMTHITGSFDLTASADGYPSQKKDFTIVNGGIEEVNFFLGSSSGPTCFLEDLFGVGSREIMAAQRFRDEVLARHALGRGMIRLYYRLSPGLKDLADGKETVKQCFKRLIRAMIPVIEKMMD